MYELTTSNMPQHLIASADDLARAIPTAVGLVTDPDARVAIRYGALSATIEGELILINADYDRYNAYASFRLVNGVWDCTSASANNLAIASLVLRVAATLSNEAIIPGAAYSVSVNRIHLATGGSF